MRGVRKKKGKKLGRLMGSVQEHLRWQWGGKKKVNRDRKGIDGNMSNTEREQQRIGIQGKGAKLSQRSGEEGNREGNL